MTIYDNKHSIIFAIICIFYIQYNNQFFFRKKYSRQIDIDK